MKNKLYIIGGAIIAIILAVVTVITMLPKTPTEPVKNPTDSSNTVSTTSEIEIEGVEDDVKVDKDDEEFLEPDESEADKIIEEHINKSKPTESKTTTSKQTTSKQTTSKQTTSKKTTTSKKNATTENRKDDKAQSFEESKKELENSASDYLKKHKINPATAGETGETCAHCGKKIWDMDKHGLCIPGMPESYEKSGY